jgi:heme-degrading monooxygenase HmoA
MYLRLTTFRLHPGNRAQVEASLEPFRRLVAEQPGFESAVFAFDLAGTAFVAITIWSSHADAEAVTRTVRDGAEAALGAMLSAPPTTEILEVYEPTD